MAAKTNDSTQQKHSNARSVLWATMAVVLLIASAAMSGEDRPPIGRFWMNISTRSSSNKEQLPNNNKGPALRKLDAISDDPNVLNVHVGAHPDRFLTKNVQSYSFLLTKLLLFMVLFSPPHARRCGLVENGRTILLRSEYDHSGCLCAGYY